MNIGIDIDDTLSNSFESVAADAQRFDIEELGNSGNVKNYGKIDNHCYIENMYPHWTKEQIDLFWDRYFVNMLTKATPKQYASEIIGKLKDDGNKITIITSRYEVIEGSNWVEDCSKKWFEKYNIPYDTLILNAQDKLEAAKKEGIELFIDDSVSHCKRMQEGGIKSFLYTSIMNQNLEIPELERVYSWVQIYDKYKKIKI